MRRLAFGVIAAIAAAAAVGGPTPPGDAGPLILYGGEPNADDADLHGVLVREGDCLNVDWEDPRDGDDVRDGRGPVAFPARKTRWDEKCQAVRFGRHVLRVGAWVDIGGGSTLSVATDEFDWTAAPNPACDDRTVWLIG
jgi:hypothetical protein